MSFGIEDATWVDPDPAPPAVCNADCEHYVPSPCDCGCVWCLKAGAFVTAGEVCYE